MQKKSERETGKEGKFTDVQRMAVNRYLSQRLGRFGVKEFDFMEERKGHSYSQKLPAVALGIFGMALTSCRLLYKVWGASAAAPGRSYVECELRYEHAGGGSNGCKMGLGLFVGKYGYIEEDAQQA
jgi:hypothetical protein